MSFSVALPASPTLTPRVDTNVTNLNGNQTESFVAANPASPANLIAYSNSGTGNQCWYSTNGGSSWTLAAIPAPANTAASADRDPALAFDRNGVAYLAYLADDTVNSSLNHIVVAKSLDGGATWTSTDIASGVVYHPYLLAAESPADLAKDNVYVAYRQDVVEGAATDSQVHVRASADGGQTFPVNQVINDNSINGIGNASYCTLAVGTGGRLYAAWEDSTAAPTSSDVRVDTSPDGGATWGTDSTIIIGAASGTTGVTYNVGASGHYTIPAAPDQGILATPSLAVARTGPNAGRVYVCYTFIAPGAGSLTTFAQTDVRLVYTDNFLSGAPTWTAKKVNDDTNAAKSQFHPWMTLDPSTNYLYFTWSDCRNSSSNNTVQRYATFSTDGGTTIRPNVLISNGTSNESSTNGNRDRSNYGDYNAHASVGGVIDAAWTDNSGQQSNDIYFDRVALNGQTVTASGTAADDAYYVRLDTSGTFLQVWENHPAHTGTPDFTLLRSEMTGLTLAPGAGKNSITIDYTNGNPLPAGGLTLNGGGDDTLQVIGSAPASAYAINGGTVTLTAANPSDTTNLTVSVASGTVLRIGSTLELAALNLADGASAALPAAASPGGVVLVTKALGLAGTAKLDVFNNAVVVDYTGTTVLPAIRANVVSGYNVAGAPWNGAGIVSTTAKTAANAGVGYAEAADALQLAPGTTGMFLGRQVDATSVLIRYTLLGDATLDGTVDFLDLAKLAQNYNVADGARTWGMGDFTYDGNVDFLDLAKMAQVYNTALVAPVPLASASSFSEDLASAMALAAQPTPTTSSDPTLPADPRADDERNKTRPQHPKVFSVAPVDRPKPRPSLRSIRNTSATSL